ncbi:MAG: hypothetical protein KBD53_04310 [Candidatus Omnitrophica bacterium]|nr:hypothetical protein [Candidatus Omnitrophota bacterium]
MSKEYSCEGCRKLRLIDPPQDKFGEVVLLKFDQNLHNIKVDEALGNIRYEVLDKQREFICDHCVVDSRKLEFFGMTVFYVSLVILTWAFSNEGVVQVILFIALIGAIMYFLMRTPDSDLRDQILKKSLKQLGKLPVTRKESKIL